MSKKKKDMQQATDEYISSPKNSSDLVAKKDFIICQNEYLRKIEAGDDLSDVPGCYHQNLIAEGVI